MAVVDRNSTAIANAVAVPITKNNPADIGNIVRRRAGRIATAADDSANSVQRYVRVPSNASQIRVFLSCADAATAGNINLGVYQTAENGGAVVDADLFAAAFALTNGPYTFNELTFSSGEYTYAEFVQPLWQVLGLSADPVRDYDIAQTITTNFNGGPTSMLLTVEFVV